MIGKSPCVEKSSYIYKAISMIGKSPLLKNKHK
jgi:hypothetical protein